MVNRDAYLSAFIYLKESDPDVVLDTLNLTSAELLEAFPDKVDAWIKANHEVDYGIFEETDGPSEASEPGADDEEASYDPFGED